MRLWEADTATKLCLSGLRSPATRKRRKHKAPASHALSDGRHLLGDHALHAIEFGPTVRASSPPALPGRVGGAPVPAPGGATSAMPALDNPRHETFAQQLAIGATQDAAYIHAGYRQNRRNAGNLALKPHVQARVQQLKALNAMRADVSAGRVLAEYARIAFADITEALERDAKGLVTVRDLRELSPDLRAAIAAVTVTRDGTVSIKMHSKAAALDALAKHLSLWRENVDVNVQ